MIKKFLFIAIFSIASTLFAQQSQLSVEKIMQDPKWMGTFPSEIKWDDNSEAIYFNYNKDNDPSDSLYRIKMNAKNSIEKVHWSEEKNIQFAGGNYNASKTKKVY